MSERATRITIEPELRDRSWAIDGGTIEQRFRAPGTRSILLDLSRLVWADPVPLLAVACLCAEFRDRGGQLAIELGTPRGANHEFRIFFAQHGFLAAMASETPVRWGGRVYAPEDHDELDQRLRTLAGALAYQDAECIPAQLIPLRALTPERLDGLVESLVDIAHPRISTWLPGNSRRRGLMTHQVRVFLTEALDNVQEHAYRNGIGYGAIYGRIRAGLPEEPAARRAWSIAKSRELFHCPTLNRCRAGRRPGWLELFVCDVGVGITYDFSQEFPDEKAPLHKLSTALFNHPVSRVSDRASAGKTNMTGLQRIGQLLLAGREGNNRGDFVRVYSNGEWVGEHLPWPKDQNALVGLRNLGLQPGAEPPTGTVLHFSLEPPPETAAEQAALYPSAFYSPTSADLANVRAELARAQSRECPNLALFDVYRASRQQTALDLGQLREAGNLGVPTLVVRPSRIQRKIDLIRQVAVFLAPDNEVKDLIFVDVPWSSAIDFYNIIATQSSWRPTAAAGSSLRVHILSQDWFCATLVFNAKSRSFEPSLVQAQSLVAGKVSRPSAAQAAAVLRRQDSLLFWNEAADSYLNEPVLWRTSGDRYTTTIWGYLDLNFALARPAVHEIVRRATRRTVSSLLPQAVHAADEIIARVLETDFELESPNLASPDAERRTVLAGSVLGSGQTIRRGMQGAVVPYHGVLQVLRHPGFETDLPNELLALDWLPPKPRGRRARAATFERVANTPFVIRGGEAAVPLARFAKPRAAGQPRQSLYGESPNDAYQRWQRLGILRLGHWTYGANHDLLTLRLADALVYDAAEGGPLVNWLAAQIDDWIPDAAGERKGFVVYAQHRVSSELARALSRHASCKGIQFFPALASSQGKAALTLSPMTREALIATCQGRLRSGGAAIILDDGILSGATMRTIRQAIEGLWEVLRDVERIDVGAELRVHTLAVVDRSGEPPQRALVERNLNRDRRYWRWDVPSLGHRSACILCSLHTRWQALRSVVHGSLLSRRLDQWLKQWAAIPVEEGRFDAGVPARRLPVRSATRFGMERGQPAHQVTHSLSVSRVSIAAEIAGATTRKDYPLRKARQALGDPQRIDVETALEILTSQLLLFPDGLSSADRTQRLQLLLKLLWSHPESTITTALAGMTTLLDQTLVEEIWKACTALIERRGFPNEDTILVALALFHMAGNEAPPPLKRGTAWEIFDLCRRSSTEARQALAMLLRVFGWSPNSVHRTTLPDLLGKRELTDSDLAQTSLILERLADAFEGIPQVAIEGSLLSPREDSAMIRKLAAELEDARCLNAAISEDEVTRAATVNALRALLDDAWTKLFSARGLHVQYREKLCASLSGHDAGVRVLVPAWRIVLDRWEAFVWEKGSEVLDKWPEEPTAVFETADGATKPVDLYYDGTIRSAVAELMSNVVHRSQPIVCPWPEGSEIPSADLWGRVRVAVDGASAAIELVNGFAGSGEVRAQMTPSLAHLIAMTGDVEITSDPARGVIVTKITIPTAAGLTGS